MCAGMRCAFCEYAVRSLWLMVVCLVRCVGVRSVGGVMCSCVSVFVMCVCSLVCSCFVYGDMSFLFVMFMFTCVLLLC